MTRNQPVADADNLPHGQVHVYSLVVPPEYSDLVIRRADAARVLSPSELERFDRYQVQRRRNDLVLSRVLFQVILKLLGLGRDGSFGLDVDANGKPHLTSRAGTSSLHLNTSDTTGMITWAFSRHGPLGCDVERIGADKDEIAESHFAPPELADYRSLAGADKTRRFYEVWTLKEAVLKADGRGLGIPLDSFSFRFADPGAESPSAFEILDSRAGPAPGPWRFHGFRPGADHQAAVAVLTPVSVIFRNHLLHLGRFDRGFANAWEFEMAGERRPSIEKPGNIVFNPGR